MDSAVTNLKSITHTILKRGCRSHRDQCNFSWPYRSQCSRVICTSCSNHRALFRSPCPHEWWRHQGHRWGERHIVTHRSVMKTAFLNVENVVNLIIGLDALHRNRAIFSRPGPQTIRHTSFLEEKGVLSDALRRSFSKILRKRLAEHVKKGVWDGTSTNHFLRVAVSCTIPDPTARHLKRWCEFGMCCPAVRWVMPSDVWFVFDQILFRGTTVLEKCWLLVSYANLECPPIAGFVIPSSRCVFRATNGTCPWESFPDQPWRWRAQFCNGYVRYVSTLELRH